jgi:hypothetical protein
MSFNEPVVREYLTVLLYGLPVILMVGRIFFGSWSGLFESLRFLLIPDLISLLRGQWNQDAWATTKTIVFVATSAFAVYSAHRHFYGSP